MGLSGEERTEKLYWSCLRLCEISLKLPDSDEESDGHLGRVDYLRQLCGQVWVQFLGGNSNSLHWFLGSSATDEVRGPASSWHTALLHHFSCSRAEGRPGIYMDDEFDPLDSFLSVSGLLKNIHFDKHLHHVYDIFAWSEQASYALRRYRDKYLQRLSGLSELIANIQGACFGIFAHKSEFAKAYLLHHICEMLYADEQLKPILSEDHWHHGLSRPMSDGDSLGLLRDWHWRLKVAKGLQERLLVAMEMVGRRRHYPHQQKRLEARLERFGVEVDLEQLREAYERNAQAHAEREKEGGQRYREDRERGEFTAVHGYSAWDSENDCPLSPYEPSPVLLSRADEEDCPPEDEVIDPSSDPGEKE